MGINEALSVSYENATHEVLSAAPKDIDPDDCDICGSVSYCTITF